jgi:hypothetical protein
MYEWKVTKLNRKTSSGFVDAVDWQLTKIEDDTRNIITGTCSFEGTVTTPFAELTESEILSWIWQQIDKTQTENQMVAVFVDPTVFKWLPWDTE